MKTVKELKFPLVYDNGHLTGYGGDQDWFPGVWKQRSGCGATTAANLAAYYAAKSDGVRHLYEGDIKEGHIYQKEEYVQLMEQMFTRMTPGPIGYPFPGRFAKRFVEYVSEHGLLLEFQMMCSWNHYNEAFSFVKKSIDEENPLAMLVLFHRAKRMKEDIWHWVTVSGYEMTDDGNAAIITSNCGEREVLSASMLFEPHKKNLIRIVRFFCPPSMEEIVWGQQ